MTSKGLRSGTTGAMPEQKGGVSERKAWDKKQKAAEVTKGPTVVTRSMQRERAKRQDVCETVKCLPNLSGILIRAINLCKSAKGLRYPELKEVLGARGYDVSRCCPSVKRQLKSLASKGALVRMTHKAGSSFFVVRKHQGKAGASQPPVGSEKTSRAQKMGAERTNSRRAPGRMKGAAARAKTSGLKAAGARRKAQRPTRKWKQGKRQARQPFRRQGSLAKAFQRPIRKSLSVLKRPSRSATDTVPARKRQYYSRGKPAPSRVAVRYSRRIANAAKKSGRFIGQAGSRRLRWSGRGVTVPEKGLGGPYSRTASNVRASKYPRGKTQSTGKRARGKASFLPTGSNRRAAPNSKRPRRR